MCSLHGSTAVQVGGGAVGMLIQQYHTRTKLTPKFGTGFEKIRADINFLRETCNVLDAFQILECHTILAFLVNFSILDYQSEVFYTDQIVC